jgi:predicted anti-sigma-YlaC factor YlaD
MKPHPLTEKAGKKAMLIFLAALLTFTSGCSLKRFMINKVGDAMVSGNSVFETDEDIELVGDALPFGLKLMESLLAQSPDHYGLLLTSCKGFVLYSYAYVDYEAEITEEKDLDQSRAMKIRARKLYLRAARKGFHALENLYPGFQEQLFREPKKAVRRIGIKKKERDLPLLYWSAAALGLAISVSRDDAALLARLPEVEAMIDRGLELDETWENGSFHQFKIQLAGAKVGGIDEELIRKHYQRALELTKGQIAGLFVSYAEAISIPNQDGKEFRALMARALSVDPDENTKNRLVNLIAQRKAKWLLDHVDDLILE